MEVLVYSRPACVQCVATYRALERQGIDFRVIDIEADPAGRRAVEELGYRQLPVVIAGEEHWSGFRPDRIQELA
ncbi:glutaredoxin-like protein NrdH [Halomonas sp. NO4]|uniref:glutaredoxin-like protein NrdH n=1 Tax=Halomonas sp. NO4 TaxID=2484813 RepID=UPI0013D47CB3|nr:glutaredoxin-like protein NrdH [Halomonas sp. NO4]